MKRLVFAVLLVVSSSVAAAAAEPSPGVSVTLPEAPAPKFYLSTFLGTTLVTRAVAGDVLGPSKDLTPMLGVGFILTDAWALELDVGPTFVAGPGYTGLAVMPGLVYTANSYVYLCARVMATVHPTLALAAVPGVGLSYTFKSGWAPFAELDGVIAGSAGGGATVSAAASIGIARYF